MGYIDYCLTYDNGEVWSETRPFWDLADLERLSTGDHLQAIAETYGALKVRIVAVRLNEVEYEIPNLEGIIS